MARKHMMQRWTSSVGVTTREFHRGFLWQRQSHQVCGCWRGMHSRQSNTFHAITGHGLLNIPVVLAQFKHVYQHCSNPGCPASSDVGNTISTKTRPSQDWGGADMELKPPPKNDPVLSEDLFIHYTVKDTRILKDRAVLNLVNVPPHPGGITEWRRLNVQGQSCWTL